MFAVIGAGGVGRVIARHLGGRGRVRVGDIDLSALAETRKISDAISTRKLDASRLESVRRFIKGCDAVINASDPRFKL